MDERIQRIEKLIGTWPDFPQKGIVFRDIFSLMKHPEAFRDCILVMSEYITENHGQVDAIVGLDSRGFIFGPLISQELGVAFVPVRKAGKLPGPTYKMSYSLEYGKDAFEVQQGALKQGERVVIVDDLLATGGTMAAACKLMNELKADVLECMVLIELTNIKGRNNVPVKTKSFISFEGE